MSSYKSLKELFNINRLASSNTTVDWRPIVVTGINTDVDVGTVPEDLTRSNSGTIYFPTTAATISVVSSSANDTSAGTGAKIVLLEGLNSSWDEVTEYVTMNGVTPVVSTNSYLRINFARVVSSGTGKKNAGNITFTHGATVMRTIIAGESQAHALVFSVPRYHELFVNFFRFQFNRAGGAGFAEVVNKVFVSDANTIYLGTFHVLSEQSPETSLVIPEPSTTRVPEKCDIWYSVTSVSTNNTNISGAFRGTLVKTRAL